MAKRTFRSGIFSVMLVPSLCALGAAISFSACADDYVVTIEEGDDVIWSDASVDGPSGLLADGVKDRRLVKKGKGRLIIGCDLKTPGYAGEICIEEGYLRLRNEGACGTSAGGVTVKSGATLEGDPSYANGSLQFKDESLTFEGFGVNGVEGAVKMLPGSTWNFFTSGKKKMTGDALWIGESRLDVRFGTFDMGGYTLYASNSIAIVGVNVINPGKIVYGSENNTIVLESYVKLNGDDAKEFVMNSGSMEWKKFSEVQNWTLAISNNVSIRPTIDHVLSRTNLSTALNYNRWHGPVRIADGATLTATVGWINPATAYGLDPYHHILQIYGKVSGGGSLALAENGYLRLGCQTNDFTGGVKLGKNAILEVAGVGSLGLGGLLSVGNQSRIEFLYDELYKGLMTDEEYEKIFKFKNAWHNGKTYYSAGDDARFVGLPDYTYGKVVNAEEIGTIYHNETNTLTLSKGVSGSPKVVNTDGTLVLGGDGDFSLGEIRVRDGTLRIADGSGYHLGENTFKVHGTYPMTPRLVVGENSVLSSRDDSSSVKLPVSHVAGGLSGDNLRDYVRGVVDVSSGAVVSNILLVGGAKLEGNVSVKTNYMGAVYIRGGTLVQQGVNSRDETVVGYNANGYLEMSDGFIDVSKNSIWMLIGVKTSRAETPGHGVVHVKGGRMVHNSVGFGVNGGDSYGHFRVSGGVVSNTTLIVGKSLYAPTSGGEGTVTVDGDGELSVKGYAQLGAMSNSVSILNLNGGDFRPFAIQVLTNRCQMSGAGVDSFCEFLEGANNPVYVNFNGGRYSPSIEWSSRDWMSSRVRRYTVFAGGAAIDTGAYPRELHGILKAPTGNGVKSIPFSCDEPWRYIGSPYVKIVDPAGTGYGASAFAEFDSVNGTISGVTVISPGCDYSEETYAEIAFGGWTNTVRVTAEVAPNDLSGGFTKYGSGELQLTAAGDWHGVTAVKEGKLSFYVENALPNTAGYDISAGASVDFRGLPHGGGSLAGAGVLIGDYELSGTFTIDANDIIAGRCMTVNGNLNIAPGTRLVVKNAELLSEKFVSKAVLKVQNGTMTGTLDFDVSSIPVLSALRKDDSTLRLGSVYGTTVVIR